MDEFERGFQEELEKIGQGGLGEALRGAAGSVAEATRGREALIGAGLGAVGGGLGGYYAQKRLTGEGGLTGALGGAGLGALGGGLAGGYVGKQRAGALAAQQAQELQRRATMAGAEEALMPTTAGAERYVSFAEAPELLGAGTPEEFEALMAAGGPQSIAPPVAAGPPGREMIPPLAGGALVPEALRPETLSPAQGAALGLMGPVSEVAADPTRIVGMTPAQKALRAQQAQEKGQLLGWARGTFAPGAAGIGGGGPSVFAGR